ncbi:MAG TPA: hypothetical protein VJR89_41940, partial [Polyangiales bacterium]|nr:hypothetical protein [Polyangiales bacterium]
SSSRASQTAIALHVEVEILLVPALGTTTKVGIDTRLYVSCDFSGIALRLGEPELDEDLGQAGEQIQEFWPLAKEMLAAQASQIIGPIWSQFADMSNQKVCPHVDITPEGGIHAELDSRTGCVNTDKKREYCPRDYRGDGYRYECRNGQWFQVSSDCEPLHK